MIEEDDLEKRACERLLDCLDELDNRKDDWSTWTDSLEELSEIKDAFEVDGKVKLRRKTVLDIGTDCVKPLYIALKFEPKKIIGISDDLPNFSSDIAEKSKLLTKTKINFYDCNFFNKETLQKIREKEKIKKFDIVLLSKTLHHLRKGKCIVHQCEEHDQKDRCREDEKDCIYEFEEEEIFKDLLEYGERVIVYECFYPSDEDVDKVRGRGGHFTTCEWKEIFDHLSEHYKVKLIRPRKCDLDKILGKKKEELDTMLRKVDCICFYVQAK